MSFEKNIEDLFGSADTETSKEPLKNSELPKIDLPPLEDLLPANPSEPDSAERRVFTRIEVGERQISVRFHNQMHFAKHYLDNISVGGMFVKTSETYKMGDIVPVEFEVKTTEFGPPELFQLRGKVCRVKPEGVGLEFTNLDQVTRARLESYVQSILPRGMQVRTQAKQTTVDKLELLRQERAQRRAIAKKIFLQVCMLITLGVLNFVLVKSKLQNVAVEKAVHDQSINIDGRKVKWNEIRSLEQTSKEHLVIHTNEESIEVDVQSVQDQLPPHLQQQLQLLQSTPPAQERRRSKNSGNLINLRERSLRR